MHKRLSWTRPIPLLVAFLSLLGLYSVAHAAAIGPLETIGATASPLMPPVWLMYIGLALATLAGLETMLKGLSMVLHAIAPHTATSLDDRAAVRVDELHDKVDTLIAAIRPILPSPSQDAKAPSGVTASAIAKAVMLAVLVGGALGVGAGQLSACSSPAVLGVKTDAQAGKQAVLDCERKLAPAQLEAALVMLAVDAATYLLPGGAPNWDKLAELAIADATDLKACALAEYHAVTSSQPAAGAAALRLAAGPGGSSPLAAAVARVKAARGVGAIVTPGGTI